MRNKISIFIKLLICVIISIVLCENLFQLFASGYNSALLDFLFKIYKTDVYETYRNNQATHNVYRAIKLVYPIICAAWFVYLYIVFKKRASKASVAFHRFFDDCADVITDNYQYYKTQPAGIKYLFTAVIAAQVGILIYFIHSLPYHYDEAYSYLYFTSHGAVSSLFFYPLPNNHVFYNIVTSFLRYLPMDEIAATRLASLLASVIATWYFFKLINKIISPYTALITTCFFSFSFPVLFYGTQARGYAFLVFFALLSIYSIACIAEGRQARKYMLLYTFSCVAGFFTLPSFLYCFVVVHTILGLHFLLSMQPKKIGGFIVYSIVIVIATLLLYTPIILCNGWHALTENNGVIKRDATYISSQLQPHLQETWEYLTARCGISIYFVLVLLAFVAVKFFQGTYPVKMLMVLVIVMLLSPVPIVYMHKTIPFSRTWSYLVIPFCMAVGVMADVIYNVLQSIMQKYQAPINLKKLMATAVVLLIAVTMTSRFFVLHKRICAIDYATNKYAEVINMHKIASIGTTNGNMVFYLKDYLCYDSRRLHKDKRLLIQEVQPGDTTNYDIIITDKVTPAPVKPEAYTLIPYENAFFTVYQRNGF